jgi:hypothetical protein
MFARHIAYFESDEEPEWRMEIDEVRYQRTGLLSEFVADRERFREHMNQAGACSAEARPGHCVAVLAERARLRLSAPRQAFASRSLPRFTLTVALRVVEAGILPAPRHAENRSRDGFRRLGRISIEDVCGATVKEE